MAVLTHKERKIICDECFSDMTDYSTQSISELRKEWKLKKYKGKDLCDTCKSKLL